MTPRPKDAVAREAAASAVARELAAYRDASSALDDARAALHGAIREALSQGHTAYVLAAVTGLSESHIGRIRRAPEIDA